MDTPKTLADAILHFADPDKALAYLAAKRWPNGVICPHCDATDPMFLKTRRIWKCKACRKQFSVKVATIFNESAIGLDKWLTAIWLVSNCRNGVSSYEVARDLGVTQKTAWFMLHRIREAMQDKSATKLAGEVEVDESFIGGKSRNMHKSKRERVITGTGGKDKAIALGIVEHGGKVRTFHVGNRRRHELHGPCPSECAGGIGAVQLAADYQHAVINHAVESLSMRGVMFTRTRWRIFGASLSGNCTTPTFP